MTPQICSKPPEILPITYTQGNFRKPTDNLPITYRRPVEKSPPLIGGSLGSPPIGVSEPKVVRFTERTICELARQRWGRCTAYRMGIVVGEIGARIANPYRGRQAGLYREGIRRGRSAARETDTGQERPRRCWLCGERTMGRVFGRVG